MDYSKLGRLLRYMKKDKSDMAVKAHKEYIRFIILTVGITSCYGG